MPKKSLSAVGVTIPHPSRKAMGSARLGEAAGLRPVAVPQHLVAGGVDPQEGHDRLQHGDAQVLAAPPPLPGEEGGAIAWAAVSAVTLSAITWRTNAGLPVAGSAWATATPAWACITVS